MSEAIVPDVPEIIRRYLNGELIRDIAKECNKSRRTIYDWMIREKGEEGYYDLVTSALVARVSDADQELEDARLSGDPVRVSAAREVARFARMDLERRRPFLYGQKKEVKHTGDQPGLTIVLLDKPSGNQTGGALVDGTPVVERLGAPVAEKKQKETA